MDTLVVLWVDGELLSKNDKYATTPLDFVPRVGDKIIYKTFGENPEWKKQETFYLEVLDVVFQTEETWNSGYKNKKINVYTKKIKPV